MKKMVRFLVLLGAACAMAPAAFAGWNGLRNLPEFAAIHKTGLREPLAVTARKPAPNFTYADQHGIGREIASQRGRVLLVNFWATWCAPCIKEMPSLDELQSDQGGANFEVLAVSEDRGGADEVKKFYERQSIRRLKVLTDPDGAAFRQLALRGLPSTLLIDKHGRIAAFLEGPEQWDSPRIQEMIVALKAEP